MKIEFKVGMRVRHGGTRAWGEILEIKPQADGSHELLVQRDQSHFYKGDRNHPTWWASYRISEFE